MPSAAVVNPTVICGSWFPTGYHGHFRSKSRSDLYSDFRQIAKPQPPKAFITRLKERPNSHVFSHHDNRFSFTTDATYLDMGVGKKRRILTAFTTKPTRELISWDSAPRINPDLSVYRSAFTGGGACPVPSGGLPLTALPPSLPFNVEDRQDRRTSSYRYTYGTTYNPNRELINALNHETLLARPASMKPPRIGHSANRGRESVADCLIWDTMPSSRPPSRAEPATRFITPSATLTQEATSVTNEKLVSESRPQTACKE